MKKDRTEFKKNSTKKTKKISIRAIILIVLSVMLLGVLSVGAYTVFFYKPDNGSNSEDIPFDTSGLVLETDPSNESSNNGNETDSSKNNPPPAGEKDEVFNVLLLGRDSVALNTDVIMLVNYNVTTARLSIMQLPRDTYIELDNCSYKLNSMYAHYYYEGVNKGEKDPEAYGLTKLSELFEQNLCINIHYYAMVNLEGFRNIVDILGGVELDIPEDMYYTDDDQGLVINLKKGKQLLDGHAAEGFVRYRVGYVQADIGRMDAQKIFMSALLQEVKDHFNVTTIVKIANEVFKNVKTDVKLNDMIYFAKNLLSVDMQDMSFMSMTGYSPTPPEGSAWFYVMNRKGVLNLVNEYFNVYDFNITDSIFDKNRIFTSTTLADYLNPYYIAEPEDCIGGKINSAEDINGGSITIPRY